MSKKIRLEKKDSLCVRSFFWTCKCVENLKQDTKAGKGPERTQLLTMLFNSYCITGVCALRRIGFFFHFYFHRGVLVS